MRISFIPQRRDTALDLHRQGDVLIFNGDAFDFSSLPDGAMIAFENSPSDWFLGPIERFEGELQVTLALPFQVGGRHVETPLPLNNPPDGPVALPKLDSGRAVGDDKESINVES